ncbi:MAG: ATP-binding cassette domain-containing protein [Candidatus Fimivivens sp.]
MKEITVLGGVNKKGEAEAFNELTMRRGEMYAIVGNTGSGKSRLIKDIEQMVLCDSVSKRQILLDGQPVNMNDRNLLSLSLIAHLGQNMRFIMDNTVAEFLNLHQTCRNQSKFSVNDAISIANTITAEHIDSNQSLSSLSGGQARALMVVDIACICNSPIVLIDEVENAGIDKTLAFEVLSDIEKLVLVVTHDPHTALMADKRIIMHNGGVMKVLKRSKDEKILLDKLDKTYKEQYKLQQLMRNGERLQ